MKAGGTVLTRANIRSVKRHPDYNPSTNDADITVIKLKTALDFSDSKIGKVTLPSNSKCKKSLNVGKAVIVTGWGAHAEGGKLLPSCITYCVPPVINN